MFHIWIKHYLGNYQPVLTSAIFNEFKLRLLSQAELIHGLPWLLAFFHVLSRSIHRSSLLPRSPFANQRTNTVPLLGCCSFPTVFSFPRYQPIIFAWYRQESDSTRYEGDVASLVDRFSELLDEA